MGKAAIMLSQGGNLDLRLYTSILGITKVILRYVKQESKLFSSYFCPATRLIDRRRSNYV